MTAVPLVLLNAFPLDKEQWEPLLEALDAIDAPIGDIITFDPPGIGDMPPTDEDPSLDLIADAAVEATREVTGQRAALWVGCSMGGYIAMAVQERHPDAVAGIGLLGTKAGADSQEALARRAEAARAAELNNGLADPMATAKGLLGAANGARADLVEWIAANAASQRGVGISWGQRAMAARADRLDVLRGCDAPAFVARGDDDAVTSLADAEAMADALDVPLVTVVGAGHLLAVEAPTHVARLIADLALRALKA